MCTYNFIGCQLCNKDFLFIILAINKKVRLYLNLGVYLIKYCNLINLT